VTSAQLKYGVEDSLTIINHPSWTLEQLKKACQNEEFYHHVVTNLDTDNNDDRDEVIERMFSLAGGSVRWMFGYNDAEVMKDITSCINKCSNMKDIVAGLHGDGSHIAVNHLLSKDKEGNASILSRYIVLQLSKKCEASFVSEASNIPMAVTNPAWDGWIFQIDFFMQLRFAMTSKSTLTLHYNDQVEEWVVPRQVQFRDPTNLRGKKIARDPSQEYENKLDIKPNDWLITAKWNPGCYDAAQLLTGNCIRIVQVARAQSYSLKLRFVQHLISTVVSLGFRIETIDLVVVVPRDEVNDFKISPSNVTGELRAWKWDVTKLRVCGLNQTKIYL